MELTPELVLAMWAGGIAGAGAVVAWWRIVGAGFIWLASGVTLLFGVPAAAVGGGPAAVLASIAALAALVLGRRPVAAAVALAGAAGAYVAAAAIAGEPVFAVAGALALGGVTSEMLLGHWYLVDPRLPRWALRRLDIAAVVGLALDAGILIADGALDWAAEDAVIGWAFVAMAVFSVVLLAGVWFALKEPSYTGVMAATGLSYLAVLTVCGSVVVGRVLLDTTGAVVGA